MQKQEIPPFTPCHSGSDLALNQLELLQAISRPPWRHPECSLNSKGPLGPLSTVPTWWVAPVPARTNRTLISRRANQRAAEAWALSYHRCEVSGCVHKWLLLCGQEGLVPFHDRCRELTLCLLSPVLSWCQIEFKTLLSCLFACLLENREGIEVNKAYKRYVHMSTILNQWKSLT